MITRLLIHAMTASTMVGVVVAWAPPASANGCGASAVQVPKWGCVAKKEVAKAKQIRR